MASALSREAITKRDGKVGDGDGDVEDAWFIEFPEFLSLIRGAF
jgi:hypothetical protein